MAPNVNNSTQAFTITVQAHNVPPTFTASSPPAVNENSGAVTIAHWASYTPGAGSNPAGEALLRYNVTAISNPSLFSAAPAIDNNGTLTYTPAANTSGTSTFTVTAQDAGGTANGNDTSAPQTFTVTVNFVNQPPTFTLAGNPPTVNQNAPAQSVTNFATGISAGPANESNQSLLGFTITETGSTGNLTFTTPPAINLANGTLTYQPAPGTAGTATFNATLTDNGSNVAPNVNNTTHSFTITVAQTSVTIGNQTLSHTQGNLTINLLPTGTYQVQEAGTQAWFVAHNVGLFFTGNYTPKLRRHQREVAQGQSQPIWLAVVLRQAQRPTLGMGRHGGERQRRAGRVRSIQSTGSIPTCSGAPPPAATPMPCSRASV